MSRRSVAAYALLLLAAGACAIGPRTPRPSFSDTPSPGISRPADGSMTLEEFEDDINGAVDAADKYWQSVFDRSGLSFRPVREIIPYRSSGEVSCGGDPVPRNNALYCSSGDFIAYDVRWAVASFRQIGDAFLYYLLGHEYAHAIQTRLGVRHEYTIDHELQADCMAGAYIGDSVRSKVLQLEDGDLEELRAGLQSVADDPGQPWFAPEAHGSARQRTESFEDGYDQGLSACSLS